MSRHPPAAATTPVALHPELLNATGLYTYEEAAALLKTTPRHVERLISRRQLDAVALGQGDKLPRIRPLDLFTFINGLTPISRDDDDPAEAIEAA
jgi:excisionase family DNA binding protein